MKNYRTLLPLAIVSVAAVTAGVATGADDTAIAAKQPLKVFILSGQSNMQGHAQLSTFDVIGLDPKTAPMLKEMRRADGTPRVCEDVWISAIGCADEEQIGQLTTGFGAAQGGPKIGPEFTFGIYMQKLVDEPILIIKTAWGGKSLNTDFRPPSAGPYQFSEADLKKFEEQGKDIEKIKADRESASGQYYRLMIDHVKQVLGDIKRVYPGYDPRQGYELAGFVWFQGWNDMVDQQTYPDRAQPGGYRQYSEVLAHFIRDVRKDLATPELPFVIGVMGAGGPIDQYTPEKQRYAGIHGEFRKAMAAPAAMPEFEGNVAAVLTENYWDMELESLRAKDQAMQKELKASKQAGEIEDEKPALAKRRAEAFTPRELRILTEGASNFEFHYLGSGKILGQIGKAFAEAMAGLMEK